MRFTWCVLVCLTATFVFAEEKTAEPRKLIVIDASDPHFRRLWWLPQLNRYDPSVLHDGMALVSFLKNEGYDVKELCPFKRLQVEDLEGADLVIRIGIPYRDLKLLEGIYDEYLRKGGRVLLTGNGGIYSTTILKTTFLGLETDGPLERVEVKWDEALDLSKASFPSKSVAKITGYPHDTQILAAVEEHPVAGVYSRGKGQVLFLGAVEPWRLIEKEVRHPLIMKTLLKEVLK
jgi:hypothetical protein